MSIRITLPEKPTTFSLDDTVEDLVKKVGDQEDYYITKIKSNGKYYGPSGGTLIYQIKTYIGPNNHLDIDPKKYYQFVKQLKIEKRPLYFKYKKQYQLSSRPISKNPIFIQIMNNKNANIFLSILLFPITFTWIAWKGLFSAPYNETNAEKLGKAILWLIWAGAGVLIIKVLEAMGYNP